MGLKYVPLASYKGSEVCSCWCYDEFKKASEVVAY